MKSSRRKQTNPNRVAAGNRDSTLAGSQPLTEADLSGTRAAVDSDFISAPENAEGEDTMMLDRSCEEESEGPSPRAPRADYEFPLDMSSGPGVKSPTAADGPLSHRSVPRPSPAPASGLVNCDSYADEHHKRQGATDIRQPSEPKRPRLDVAEASTERDEEEPRDFPTAYHRLGRELQGNSADAPLTNGHLEEGSLPEDQPARGSTTPSQPFNPEHQPSSKRQASPSVSPYSAHLQRFSPSSYPDNGCNPHERPPPPLTGAQLAMSNKDGTVVTGSSRESPPGSGGSNSNAKADRIFHMDAYCDLCDREFCNKYFLKTHKANKHGIYEDNSPPASNVPLPFPGLMMPQDPMASFNFKMDPMKPPLTQGSSEPLAPWSFKLDSTPQQSKKQQDGSSNNISRSENSPSLPLFPMPLPLPPSIDSQKQSSRCSNDREATENKSGISVGGPHASSSSGSSGKNTESSIESSSSAHNDTSSSTSILTSITNSIKSNTNNSSNNPPTTDPSMEDYCHICQKHFCNKYYLKKHKQDVHGIAPETPPNSTNKRSRSSVSSASNNLLDHPLGLSSHNGTSPFNLPQPLASLAGMHGLSGMPGIPGMPGMAGIPGMPNMPNMPNMPPGVMVINPYSLPPMAIIPGSLVPGQQLPPPPHHPMGMTPLPDSALLPPPSSSSASSSSTPNNHANSSSGLSPSASKPSPSIQDGGVHCNICSKEFCNEFYLQIHKESKHGIRRGGEDQTQQQQARDKAIFLVKDTKYEHGLPSRSSPPPLSKSLTPKSEPSSSLAPSSRSPVDNRSSSAASGSFPPEERVMVCNMCSKEFSNKYLYRIHRIHDHGLNELIDPTLTENGEMPSKEEAMRSMNESLLRMAADPSAVSHAPNFTESPPGNNVLSSKQSPHSLEQTAVCDICNKEMTNQYFLRLHKFNVHGIDPTTNEKYDSKKSMFPTSPSPSSKPKTPPSSVSGLPPSSPGQQPQPLNLTPHHPGKHPMLPFFPPKMDFKDMPLLGDFGRDFHKFRDMPSFLSDTINNELFARSQNPVRHMDLNFFGLPSLGKLPEDNVKLNFDPEAYCDICKKEFCSKYFLRTHKQNIHGIKSDPLPGSLPKNSGVDPDKLQMPLKPSINSTNNNNNNISGNPSNNNRSRGMNVGALDADKNSWRWKEPVNSSRVVCDICNKEVCNKYFLRTHKQKKHGIPLSAQSPNVSVSGSPVASDCDSASNASSLPDEKPSPLAMFRPSDPFNLPQMIPLPPSDTSRFSDKHPLKQHPGLYGPLGKIKDEFQTPMSNNNNNNNIADGLQSETCNICSRRFKSVKWLKDHILKDHHIAPSSTEPALHMRSSSSSTHIAKSGVTCNNSNKDAPVYTCQVCRANFPAELSVQLHLIQEHNARVTLDTEPEPRIPTEEASLPSGERADSNGSSPRVAELTTHWGSRKKASPASWSSDAACRMKRYVCTRCDGAFSTLWLSSLLEHERVEHGVQSSTRTLSPDAATVPGFVCRQCNLNCQSPNALSAHLITVHAVSVETALLQAKDSQRLMLPSTSPPSPPNCFRCSRCPAVFPTRAWGVAHVRHVHIRSRRDLRPIGRKGPQASPLRCPSCSFKTRFASRLQRHVSFMHSRPAAKSNNSLSLKNGNSFGKGLMMVPPSLGANMNSPVVPMASSTPYFGKMSNVIMSTYSRIHSGSSDMNSATTAASQGTVISSSINGRQVNSQPSSAEARRFEPPSTELSGDENEEVDDDDDDDDDDDATTNNSPPSSIANDENEPQSGAPHGHDEDGGDDDSALVSTSGVYQSIAASLLAVPASDVGDGGRRATSDDSPSPPGTPNGRPDASSSRDGPASFLQGFRHQLPLRPSAVDSSPFKMAGSSSAASAVVGSL